MRFQLLKVGALCMVDGLPTGQGVELTIDPLDGLDEGSDYAFEAPLLNGGLIPTSIDLGA